MRASSTSNGNSPARSSDRQVEVGRLIESSPHIGKSDALLFEFGLAHVEQVIDRDPIQPGPESALTSECAQLGYDLIRISWVASSATSRCQTIRMAILKTHGW